MKNIFTVISIIILITLFAVKVAIAQGTWTQKADFPREVPSIAGSFSIDNKCYIVVEQDSDGNSLSDFWEWNQETNSWIRKADFPANSIDGAVGFSIGTKGYIGTGNYSNLLWEYDPLTDVWTQKASLPDSVGRSDAVGFSIGTKGYIGLGRKSLSEGSDYYKDFWEWDQATNEWTQKADFGGPARAYAVGFSIGNKGYAGTGQNYEDSIRPYYKDFWEWDQATNSWTQKADLEGSERHRAAGFSIGNKGYIGIGFLGNIIYLDDFWEWNQQTNTWTQKANYRGNGFMGNVGLSIGDKGYIGFGYVHSGYKADFWEYAPSGLEDSLIDIIPEGSMITKLSSNQFVFTEGPVWYYDSLLLFVDDGKGSPNIFQYDPVGKQFSAWPTTTPHSVGLASDRDGNLIGTSNNIIMINKDGKLNKTVASSYNDKPFNNPNDLIADKKGGVYFTDPDFFLTTPPQDKTAVYYIDSTGIIKRVIDDLAKPNGLVLSPDGTKLYVVDTEINNLYSWTVASDGSVSGKSTFAELDTMEGVNNYADGMAVDSIGNIYVATNMGIQVFTPQGAPITTIVVPESPSNCDFGGKDFKTLFITARKNLYSIDLKYPGYAVSREKGIPNTVNPPLDQPLVSIYPNPVHNVLHINLAGKTGVLEVLDITGKSILQKEILEDHPFIDVSVLRNGIYFVKVITDNHSITGKFVKQ